MLYMVEGCFTGLDSPLQSSHKEREREREREREKKNKNNKKIIKKYFGNYYFWVLF
jgi:hypothetical protein